MLFFWKGCEKDHERDFFIDENNDLIEEIELLNSQIDTLRIEKAKVKSTIIEGKERIKYLKDKVVIHDTIIIEYVQTMEVQLIKYDTLVQIQEKEIIKLDEISLKKDTIILNKDKEIKGLKRKNKVIKLGAIIGIIATIALLK